MRSKIAQQIIDETPNEVKVFVKKYSDLVVRIHQVLREKGITQKELAKRLDKTPSEISKWLGGGHNFTLRSIAKLEAELDIELLQVSRKDSFHVQRNVTISATVAPQKPVGREVKFIPGCDKSIQGTIVTQAS